jgi:hypothetical protein
VWGSFDGEKTRFARDRQYKLYRDGRLFDTRADPLEQAPLPDGTDLQAVRQILQSALDAMPPWQPLDAERD